MTADEIIQSLGLVQHPEGGWYSETWRAPANADGRDQASLIYFLLKAGEASHWHRVDADEIWLWHAGSSLTLSIAETVAGPARHLTLGPDVVAGHAAQLVVPKDHWQKARSDGDFTLVSCVVSPAFRFEGFVLAEPGFDIP